MITWVFGDKGPRGNSKELQANTAHVVECFHDEVALS